MKKQRKKLILVACLLLSLAIGMVANASTESFNTTTPTFGTKYNAYGTKDSGSVTYATMSSGDCEEDFLAMIQADNDGWVTVTNWYQVEPNATGSMNYTLTPASGTSMRLGIQDVGVFGGQIVRGTINYR